MPPLRRLPPPWTIDEAHDACFIVRDSTGQALGYFYFEDEPGRRSAAKLLTRDEARRHRRIARKLAHLQRCQSNSDQREDQKYAQHRSVLLSR
jgi:hypothetical protein